MLPNTTSQGLNALGVRLAARGKVSLVAITLLVMLIAPSAISAEERSSVPKIEQGDNRNDTPSSSRYQSAAGRYLEPGEVSDLAEEQGISTLPGLVGGDAAGSFLIAAAQSGIVSLNQTTGSINFCVGYSYLNSGTPFGKCKKIGTISPTGLLGNARIDTTSNVHAFVTNTATGLVVECYLGFSSGNGEPLGKCISLQLQP